MQRFQRLQIIQQLDPVEDNCELCRQIVGYEFPWDMTRSLELALMRTFCAPSIATLLDRTGEFHHRTQKRYDDTAVMISLILKLGHDTPDGQRVIQRMNQIHGHFPISNADYLYVLSTFIYEPVRWLDRFGWRPLSTVEKHGLYYFWQAIGQQMGIHDIPASYEALEAYNLAYEANHFRYNPANQRVGESTVNLFLSWFPAPLRPLVQPMVYAMMDDRMIAAFGFPQPQPWQRQFVERVLRSRGNLLRYWPPRRSPNFYSDEPQRSYPHGYTLNDLGPPQFLEDLNRH